MLNESLKSSIQDNAKLLAMVEALQKENKRLTDDNSALLDGKYISPELVQIQKDLAEDPTGEKALLIAQLRRDLEEARNTIRTGQSKIVYN